MLSAPVLVGGALAWLGRTGRARQRLLGLPGTAARRLTADSQRPWVGHGRTASITLPADVEQEPLLADLRQQFVCLQAAWDLGEIAALRSLILPEMLGELCFDGPDASSLGRANRTDVVTLQAQLLGFEELAGNHWVSVEFSGLIRESQDQGAQPFRELWMLAKSKQEGSGWKLARHQALL